MTQGNNSPENGWMKLWHPGGVQVTIPVEYGPAAAMLRQVETFLAAGWLADAPGLEDGEQVEEVVSVSRREGRDGTPILAFYQSNPKLRKKFMHVYLNTTSDVDDFEAASGLRLADIPLFEGERDIDRDHHAADHYIVSLPRALKLVWKINPKWSSWKTEGGEGQEPHKRLLVRYAALAPVTPSEPAADTPLASRCYGDGSPLGADPNEQAAFEAFLKHRRATPASKEGLRGWVASNKRLIDFPQPTAA